jgi:hypothetical protein
MSFAQRFAQAADFDALVSSAPIGSLRVGGAAGNCMKTILVTRPRLGRKCEGRARAG